MKFFVMLYDQDGGFTPLLNAKSEEPGVDETMAKFDTEDELKAQVDIDIQKGKEILRTVGAN